MSSAKNAFGSALPAVVARDGWEGAWRMGITPWDAGRSPPFLPDLISRDVLPRDGLVLVPGVGAGYDALTFARSGRHVLGVDLSETAIARCEAAHAASAPPSGSVEFEVADFFQLDHHHHRKFSIIYDYTFLQALPPVLWPPWADAAKRLLSPGGVLCHVIFPTGSFEGGPPFAMQPENLERLLSADFMCLEMQAVPAHLSFAPRAVSGCRVNLWC